MTSKIYFIMCALDFNDEKYEPVAPLWVHSVVAKNSKEYRKTKLDTFKIF